MAESRVSRRLAAIFAIDMVGYSRLIGADEAGTIARQKAQRAELIDPKIAEYNGRIVKTTGDGLLVEFASAVDAVLCAAEVQRGMAEREADVPEDQRIAYRVGINLGEIVIDGDDILGDGVNVAARLEALAEPGGIRVSDVVFKNVKGKLDLGFADLGPQKVKNIVEPVPTYRVLLDPADVGKIIAVKRKRLTTWRWPAAAVAASLLLAVVGVLLWRQPAPVDPEKHTIAVLPFANLSGNPKQDYLGHGIAGDLVTDISKISGLLVASREASFRYKANGVDLRTVGRELKVDYVLIGDIRRAGDVLRVSVRLVNASTGFNLWAERYDRNVTEIFALQDDITRNVVAALKLKLTPTERALVGKRSTTNPAAYDLVLRARAAHLRLTPKSEAAAIALYQQAIELDPNFADAYVELGYANIWKWTFTGARDPSLLDRGLALANKALAIDPSLASAHMMFGWVHLWRKEHDQAIRSMEYAIKLDPNNGENMSRFAFAHVMVGKPREALEYIRLARLRTRFEPNWYAFNAGTGYLYLNRHDDAVRELKASLSRNPRFFGAHRFLAVVYVEMGRMKEAREAVTEALRLNPRTSISFLRRQLPFKNSADLERQFRALRKVGFPE